MLSFADAAMLGFCGLSAHARGAGQRQSIRAIAGKKFRAWSVSVEAIDICNLRSPAQVRNDRHSTLVST